MPQILKAYDDNDANIAAGATPIYWNAITAAPDTVGQGTWVRVVNATLLYNGTLFNSTNADGDNVTYNFRCPAGTYTFSMNGRKSGTQGIVDVYIDGVEKGSFDHYDAGNDFINIDTIASLILTAGTHTVKFQIDGQNASASGHFLNLQAVSFTRTS